MQQHNIRTIPTINIHSRYRTHSRYHTLDIVEQWNVDPTNLDRISTIDLIKISPLSSCESLESTSRAVSLMTVEGKGYAVGGALHLHLFDSAVYPSAFNPLSIPPSDDLSFVFVPGSEKNGFPDAGASFACQFGELSNNFCSPFCLSFFFSLWFIDLPSMAIELGSLKIFTSTTRQILCFNRRWL